LDVSSAIIASCSCWNSILWALVVMILSYFRVMITVVKLLAAWPTNIIFALAFVAVRAIGIFA
jgi:hypothetical protein